MRITYSLNNISIVINAVLHIHIDNMTVCLRVPQKPWRISDPLVLEHDQTQYIYIYVCVYYIYIWSRVSCSHPAPIWYGGGLPHSPPPTTHTSPPPHPHGGLIDIYIYIHVYYLDICIYTYMYITHIYIYI